MDDTVAIRPKAVINDGGWPVYSLYGLSLASNFSFSNRLAHGTGTLDVVFTCTVNDPPATGWDVHQPVYSSAAQLVSGQSLLYIYRQRDYYVIRFTEVADYYLWPDRIVCHLLDEAYEYLVEIHMLGIVFSIWLELRKIPALHASAVVVEDRVAAFLATNKGGKSSLAASLMQAGHPLLTDDVLPIERYEGVFRGRPGYPQMRMWPEQAQHFLRHHETLDLVHPAYSKRRVAVGENGLGTFCDRSQPMSCFYIPERRDPADWGLRVEITPVPRGEALMSLIGESFASYAVEALGLQSKRLAVLASLVSQVPMRRIIYPEGYEHLPEVRRHILEDLADLQPLKK
jgi:hypothetical protein